MLLEIDRVQIAVSEAASVAEKWQSLLGAEESGRDKIACLGAARTSLRLGTGIVEILEPDGAGAIADAIASRGAHMFSAGASCLDVAQVQANLNAETIVEGGQLFVRGEDIGINGLRVVISQHEERAAVGDIDFFYEATLLAADSMLETSKFAQVFSLDAQEFVQIDSPNFGYSGILTLFQKDRLHRFEVITPLDPDKTMGRFFNKTGQCLYMAYAETSDILAIEQRANDRGDGITVERPADRNTDLPADGLWLHPSTLGGMMLGLSRPTMAWRWSGHPERVEEI
jgi:hypothetical protein